MKNRYRYWLPFVLILNLAVLLLPGTHDVIGAIPVENTTNTPFSFDLSSHESSSKYYLLNSPLINPVAAESCRGPFYRQFISDELLSAVPFLTFSGAPEYFEVQHTIMRNHAHLLFPFHEFS